QSPCSGMDCGSQCAHAPNLASRHQRSEEHTSELQSRENLVCRLLLEKKDAEELSVGLADLVGNGDPSGDRVNSKPAAEHDYMVIPRITVDASSAGCFFKVAGDHQDQPFFLPKRFPK